MRLASRLLFSGLLTLSVFLFASISSSQARTTGVCTIATNAATSVGSTSAVLHGSTLDCEPISGTYRFDYGTTTAYGSITPSRAVTSLSDSTETITGLSPGTTYHFRFRWSGGGGSLGADRTFTTSSAGSGGGGTESADVGVTKTASPASVRAGTKVTFSLVVKNYGPADAIGVTLTDSLPAGLTLVSASTTKGSCSGTVSCTIGSLGKNASATVTIVVTATVAGAIKNTAEIGATNPDPNVGANNRSSVTLTVTSAGTPPPSGSPVARSISLSVGRTSASGRMTAAGFGACAAGVKVELQRRKGSAWVKVGSGRTKASGTYSLKRSAVAGLYRARAPEVTIGDRRCLAATSRSVRAP